MNVQLIATLCIGLLIAACGKNSSNTPAVPAASTDEGNQKQPARTVSADLSSIVKFDGYAVQLAKNQGLADIDVNRFVTQSNAVWRTEWLFEPLRIAVAIPAQNQPSLAEAFDLYYQLRGNDAITIDEVLVNVEFEGLSLDQSSTPENTGNGCPECEWSIAETKTEAAWNIKPSHSDGKNMGEGVEIAHLDTGYTRHPEMIEPSRLLVSRGYDYFDNDPDPIDKDAGRSQGLTHFGHGTATGSVIASAIGAQASFPFDRFVTGMAPKSSLIPIRVDNDVVIWNARRDVKGIEHAVRELAHIISMSRAGLSSKTLAAAVGYATGLGIIVVAAPGNCMPTCGVYYPAKLKTTIAPAATDEQSMPWKKTGNGKRVDISAPGHSVWRALVEKSGTYHVDVSSGTSYATAATAGSAALWLAFHGGWKNMHGTYGANLTEAFRSALKTSGVNPWPDPKMTRRYGTGVLNNQKLLSASLPSPQSFLGKAREEDSPSQGSIESIAEAFDIEDKAEVEAVLARLLGKRKGDLPANMDDVGHEIAIHLFADIAIQRMFLTLLSLPQGENKEADALYESIRGSLWDRASMRLQSVLGEGFGTTESE